MIICKFDAYIPRDTATHGFKGQYTRLEFQGGGSDGCLWFATVNTDFKYYIPARDIDFSTVTDQYFEVSFEDGNKKKEELVGNMMPEIVEAVTDTYRDYPEVELDCMLFLNKVASTLKKGGDIVDMWFDSHDRCYECGSELKVITHREVHTEVEGNSIEILTELICPICEGWCHE